MIKIRKERRAPDPARRRILTAGASGLTSALVAGLTASKTAAAVTPAGACGGLTRAQFDEYLMLFNNNDPAFTKYYHDDVVLELPDATLKGPAEIRDFYKEVKSHIKETVEVTHFVSDATGIAAELPSEFACFKDWSDGYFQRDIEKGEVLRVISFGLYWVEDGKYRRIKSARYKLVNDWRQEGVSLENGEDD